MKNTTHKQTNIAISKSAHQRITNFFEAYAQRFQDAIAGETDVDGTVNAFADYFIEASPLGVNGGKNDENFRKMIPQGTDFYKKIGTKSMKIVDTNITPLDELHYMVKVHWASYYTKKDGEELTIEFDVIYFLQDIKEELKVFAYITGDEQAVLRENGLIE